MSKVEGEVVGKDNKIETLQNVVDHPFVCSSPDRELEIYPKWIIFYSENNYKTPCYYDIRITNPSNFTQAYNLKTRYKIFKVAKSHCGILKPGETTTIKLFVIPVDDWPLGLNDYCDKHLKLAIENLRVPDNVVPKNSLEHVLISKHIWKRSQSDWPLERLYTKINICLDKVDGLEEGKV